MESIRRRNLQVGVSVATGREDKEDGQVGMQMYLSQGLRCGRCEGGRFGDRGAHEEPFMRCDG